MAAKLAYVGTARVGPVLRRLVGADEQNRILTWLPGQRSVQIACEQFELGAAAARSLFLPMSREELEERQHVSLSLRWCPACMGRWYHHSRFQDRRIRHCPWHRERLRDACDKCGRSVDPLGRPWHCGHCGEALAEGPEPWLTALKTPPGHNGMWPRPLPRNLLAYEDREEGVLCLADPRAPAEAPLHTYWFPVDYWTQVQLYESAASLWDTILREHRQCALDEPRGFNPNYYAQTFRCPVAAAALTVFGQMGLGGALAGDWPYRPVTPHSYATLPPKGSVPREVLGAMLRELPRAWLADALLLYGEVARTGRNVARWEPHPDTFQAKTAVGSWANGAQLVTKRPESWLQATALFCGECCPNGKAFTGAWDHLKLLLG